MAATDLFTLAQLADQTCQNLGATDDISQAKAKKYVNRALIRFSELGEWSWQRGYDLPFPTSTSTTTTASQKEYSVVNCLRIESLYIASPIQRRLILLPDRNYRKMSPNDTATGTPYYWRLAG